MTDHIITYKKTPLRVISKPKPAGFLIFDLFWINMEQCAHVCPNVRLSAKTLMRVLRIIHLASWLSMLFFSHSVYTFQTVSRRRYFDKSKYALKIWNSIKIIIEMGINHQYISQQNTRPSLIQDPLLKIRLEDPSKGLSAN